MARARRPAAPPPGGDPAAVELVRQLGLLLAELGLSEVEVASGALRVRVQRAAPGPAAASPPASVAEAAATLVPVEAPMVGTFYRASSPTAEPYVREGDRVEAGQIVGIIEAMKLMNEIESKASGRVAKVLVENGQPVEYGQPLFLLDPLG